MPKYRADFDVRASLVLPEGSAPIALHYENPTYDLVISNVEADASGHVPSLSVAVIGDAEAIDSVAPQFRAFLANQLDLLTFVTHSSFTIDQCRRIVDWEPHQRMRAFRVLQKFDPLYPPAPDLQSDCAESVSVLARCELPGYVRSALKYFRYGVLSSQPDEQFQNFWLAIETMAEGSKDPTKVPIPCPRCRGELWCEGCQDTPLRTPMARQAIRDIIAAITPGDAAFTYKTLVDVRDGLMHGRSLDAIAKRVGKPIGDLINAAAWIAWNAIMRSVPRLDRPLALYYRDGNFASGAIVATAVGTFEHRGEAEQPTEAQIVTMNIQLNTQFRPLVSPAASEPTSAG